LEGVLSQKRTGAASLPPAEPLALWDGNSLLGRSVRFTLSLMAPILVGLMLGASVWIAYAIMTCILCYMLDTGGTTLSRLREFAIAALVVILGAVLGTVVKGDPLLMALALGGTAMLYGLVEGFHTNTAACARFLCLSVSIAALYSPIKMLDVYVVIGCAIYSWALSVAWDMATGIWRPAKRPTLQQLTEYLNANKTERMVFSVITGLTVGVSFLVIQALQLQHVNWAILALMIVLHADVEASWRIAKSLLIGTLVGVAAAWIYGTLFTSHAALIIGMTIAAIIRWPIQDRNGSLGQAAMAFFILLMMQLIAHLTGHPSHAPADRLIDITLGCAISFVALAINAVAQHLLRKASSRPV